MPKFDRHDILSAYAAFYGRQHQRGLTPRDRTPERTVRGHHRSIAAILSRLNFDQAQVPLLAQMNPNTYAIYEDLLTRAFGRGASFTVATITDRENRLDYGDTTWASVLRGTREEALQAVQLGVARLIQDHHEDALRDPRVQAWLAEIELDAEGAAQRYDDGELFDVTGFHWSLAEPRSEARCSGNRWWHRHQRHPQAAEGTRRE